MTEAFGTAPYVKENPVDKLQIAIDALRAIQGIGGNLPDDRLTSRTGANDAAYRGGLVCTARDISTQALRDMEASGNEPAFHDVGCIPHPDEEAEGKAARKREAEQLKLDAINACRAVVADWERNLTRAVALCNMVVEDATDQGID